MFEINRSILDCDYIGNTPPSSTKTRKSSLKINNHIPGEDSVVLVKNSYFELEFDVTQNLQSPLATLSEIG